MAFRRAVVPYFEIANGAYRNAVVTFYQVDIATYTRKTTLATIYEQPAAGDQLANPYQLDGQGRAQTPIYIEEPVIAVIGESTVPSHETGIIYPLGGDYIGDWVSEKAYFPGDIVKDASAGAGTENLYISTLEHTSGIWLTDLGASYWELVVDVQAVNTSTAAAAASAAAAATSESNASTSESNASTSAGESAASAAIAQASAGSVPSASGQALNFLRQNAGETALEYRTPSEVLSDIGAQAAINNHSATSNPTVNNDSADTASIGVTFAPRSIWINTSTEEAYICLDASVGAAQWEITTLSAADLGSIAIQDSDDVTITGGSASGLNLRTYSWGVREAGTLSDDGADVWVLTAVQALRLFNAFPRLQAGTCTLAIKKNGTNIGGLGSLSVTTSSTATAVNDSSNAYIDLAVGDTLEIRKSSCSSAEDLFIGLDIAENWS